jgi:PDZ domain-containing protein
MKHPLLIGVVILTLSAVAGLSLSQEAEKELTPKPDLKALIDQLGSPDFKQRKAAEEALLKLEDAAMPALREAAAGHEDEHVRYEAERLLARLADAGKAAEDQPLEERPLVDPLDEAERQMNELLRQLEEQGMMDWGAFEEWRKLMRDRFGPNSRGRAPAGVVHGMIDTGDERIEYDQAADGRLKVSVTRDGKTEVFEAKSREELKEIAPEVYEKVHRYLGDFRLEWGQTPDPLFRRIPSPRRPGQGQPGQSGERPLGGPQETFRLGIWAGEVAEPLRVHLKLPAGVGVLVEDVVPGSFAAQIGLERFDVIRAVQGRNVASARDIRSTITGVGEGEQVVLDIIRKGEPLKLMRNR